MSNPLVSIITPLFNKELYIADTIRSVVNQTYSNWEHIIVDDHSTDNSYKLALKYSHLDKRIVIRKRKNKQKNGQTCRNEGMELAKGKYIIFLDADDCLAPFCIKNRLNFLEKSPNIDFAVFPQLIFFNKPGDSQYLVNTLKCEHSDLTRFLTFIHDRNVPWLPSSPIWKKETLVNRNIKWDNSLSVYQDIGFHISALLSDSNYIKVETEPDCFWRRGVKSNIGSTLNEPKSILNTNFMLYNILMSVYSKGLLTVERESIIVDNFIYIYIHLLFYNMVDEAQLAKGIISNHSPDFLDNQLLWIGEKFFQNKHFHKFTKKIAKKVILFIILHKYKNIFRHKESGFLKTKYKPLRG